MKIIPLLASILLVGCGGRIELPSGDSEAGRKVFADFQCYSCHEVAGSDFPAPVASPPVPVKFGFGGARKSPHYLAESIISPSHRFARPPDQMVGADPPIYIRREYENIREGELSRMGDFNDFLTVRQLSDLVAYLSEVQEGSGSR